MHESWLERWSTVSGTLAVLLFVGALMLADRGVLAEPLLGAIAVTLLALSVLYIFAKRRVATARVREWDAIASAAGLERTGEKGSLHAWRRFPTYGRKEGTEVVFLEPTGEGDGSATLVVTTEWPDDASATAGMIHVASPEELRARIQAYVAAFRAGGEPPAEPEPRARFAALRGIVAVLALVAFVAIHALRFLGMEGALARWNVDGLGLLLGVGVAYLLLSAALTILEGKRRLRAEGATGR